jgi:chromate transporter
VKEVLLLCLKLGCLGFGGPISIMAMVEEEVVQKRKWISESEFAKEFALLKLFPGPLATMLVIRMAARKAGKWGGLAGGVVFILPAFFLVLALGLYLSHVPHDSPINLFEKGIQVAALAAMTMGVWKLGASQLFSRRDFYLCALSFFVVLIWPRWEAVIILIFGIVGLFPKKRLWEGGSLFWLFLLL